MTFQGRCKNSQGRCKTIMPPIMQEDPCYVSKIVLLFNPLSGNIQKRALSIISPGLFYMDSLKLHNLRTLKDRRQKLCKKRFNAVVSNTDHKLHHLLPPKNTPVYKLRRQRPFDCPASQTNCYKNCFILSMSNE